MKREPTWADCFFTFWCSLPLLALIAVIIVLPFVAGCATTDPKPTVVSGVKATEVLTPVLMPCIFDDEVPKVPGTWMSDAQTKEKRRLAVLADLKETEDYIIKADSLLRGCAKPREAGK